MYDFHYGTKDDILNNPRDFLIFSKRLLPRWINGIPDSECLAIFDLLEKSDLKKDGVIIETGCGASSLAIFLWCAINNKKFYSWDTNGSKGSFLRGVLSECMARPLNINIYDVWNFISFDSTNIHAGIKILEELDEKAWFGYFDSWHTLEHLLNEVKSFESIASEEYIIALDDAYYTKKYENFAYINMIRQKNGLNPVIEKEDNKCSPFYLEIEKYLSEKNNVEFLADSYKDNFPKDIFFEYYSSDRKAMNQLGMEESNKLIHRFDAMKVKKLA